MSTVNLTKGGGEVVPRPPGDVVPPPSKELVLAPTRRQRVHAHYANHQRVPLVLKTKTMAIEAPAARRKAAKSAAKLTLLDLPRALMRGLFRVVVAWWKWVWCYEERQHAREEMKLHSSATNLRSESYYRWLGTGGILCVSGIGYLLLWWLAPEWWRWALLVAILGGLLALGHPKAKELVPHSARGAKWLVDGEHFAMGLREAKLIGKDDTVRVVRAPAMDGGGWCALMDMPGALKASAVIAKKEDLAASFEVDEECLVLERDRGSKGHASRLLVWSAEANPFVKMHHRFPLLDVERCSVWAPHPFGVDARGRVVDLSLMWSSLLVGARPRRGKTAASRVAATPFVLDPTVSISCFDGKGGRDWIATRPICDQYVVGADDEAVDELLAALKSLRRDVERGFTLLRELPEDECPDNKVTEEITSNRQYNLPVRLIIIDELQNYTTAGKDRPLVRGEQTVGQKIADLLVWLAKNGPALGVILMLITQRPSSESLPTELRSQVGTRFGLKVDTWQSSNMILGDLNTMGYDCSKLLGTPGVGILVPDGELAALDMGNPTLRTYYTTAADWRMICEKGARLRGIDPKRSLSALLDDERVVEAEVVTRWIDDAVAAFDGEAFVSSTVLGARLKLSPNGLAEKMLAAGVPKRHTSKARGYNLVDVQAAAQGATPPVTGGVTPLSP